MFDILLQIPDAVFLGVKNVHGHQRSEFPGDREVTDLKGEVPGVQSEHQCLW
jgi:hypothetical protein